MVYENVGGPSHYPTQAVCEQISACSPTRPAADRVCRNRNTSSMIQLEPTPGHLQKRPSRQRACAWHWQWRHGAGGADDRTDGRSSSVDHQMLHRQTLICGSVLVGLEK
jgi:hypothetical protein